MVVMFIVTNKTFEPMLAAAAAASHPACPAPATMMSYFENMFEFLSVPRGTF
jgi:hypothetical protein